MHIATLAILAITTGLFAYLVLALLYPEKF
ncbi:MAG TPA: K(+)-transporting ATPase subunit F [Acidobacteriaceae bacterium]|nr:K(+)-transporting ATPase subunit F [Acidobacteriaceae bacterium]